MKNHYRFLIALLTLFTLLMVMPASGQAPPPPAHSQNGNQAAPGGTGCPLDRPQSILLSCILCLGYAGFALYQRDRKEVL
jgi:hypothetical protein